MERFSEFFARWTHEYYAHARLGREGDFYTAVGASKFFGGSIANYILQNLESGALNLPLKIIDCGANNGNLLSDIYSFLAALSDGVVENCEFIALESSLPSRFRAIKNLSELGILDTNAIFIANEFFDALPCELFCDDKMAFVRKNKIIFDAPPGELIEFCARQNMQCGEVPLSYFEFLGDLARINPHKKRWLFLVFDYGEDFWRNSFSIRIFRKHRVFSLFEPNYNFNSNTNLAVNLSEFFGKSDITYNVPFRALDSAFEGIGAQKILFKKQYLALIEDFGIINLLEKFRDSSANSGNLYIREANKIKTLLNILNDSFKVAIYAYF